MDNSIDFVFETHLDESVCFIEDQDFDILKREAFGVLDMVKKSASGGHYEIWSRLEISLLLPQT